MEEPMNEWEEYTEDSVGAVYDTIESGMWQAERLARRGARTLAAECLRTAWHQYLRFADVLHAYEGGHALRDRLLNALMAIGDGGLLGGWRNAQVPGEELPNVLDQHKDGEDVAGVVPDDLLAFAGRPVEGVRGELRNQLVFLGR